MAPTFRISEPHPSQSLTASSPRISVGRGGAGNISQYKSTTLTPGATASGPPSRLSVCSTATSTITTPPTTKRVFSGRGGAGNSKPASERRIFSFDEELERQKRLSDAANATPVYHVGRGGAGNAFPVQPDPSARQGSSATSVSSAGSVGSVGVERAKKSLEGVRGKVARAFSRE